MKTKDLLIFAQKKQDPGDAALKECAKIAKAQRNHVWEGPPPLPRKMSIIPSALRLLGR